MDHVGRRCNANIKGIVRPEQNVLGPDDVDQLPQHVVIIEFPSRRNPLT